jgi:AAA domain
VLVVVGGLPGSGKTTLLRRWLADRPRGVAGYDSEDVAAALGAAPALPYRLLRPAVHLLHRARLLRGLRRPEPVVVLTDPWTRPGWRALVLAEARRSGRRVRLVLLDASAAAAVRGQADRGRAVSRRSMRRHARRWAADLPVLRAGEGVLVVDRAAARGRSLGRVLGDGAG